MFPALSHMSIDVWLQLHSAPLLVQLTPEPVQLQFCMVPALLLLLRAQILMLHGCSIDGRRPLMPARKSCGVFTWTAGFVVRGVGRHEAMVAVGASANVPVPMVAASPVPGYQVTDDGTQVPDCTPVHDRMS